MARTKPLLLRLFVIPSDCVLSKGYGNEEMREMVETIKTSSAKVVVTFIIDQDAKVNV